MKFNWSSIKEYSAVVDVRTPAEYALDHIPGSINMPILDNQERAMIGKMYQQDSFNARKLGMGLVAAQMSKMVEGPLRDKDSSWRPLIYCARGGMRSGSLVMALRKVGWEADALPGGYKAYRQFVRDTLATLPKATSWYVLCGPTGSGKTLLLRQLADQGAQILDLEKIANHRGSLFGSLGSQPTQRAFETALAQQLLSLDRKQRVFVESESMRIGKLFLPKILLEQMCRGKVVLIEADLTARAAWTATEYAQFNDKDEFTALVDKLAKFVGHDQIDKWKMLHQKGEYRQLAASLLELHYDRKYAWSLNQHYDLARPWTKVSLPRIDQVALRSAACAIVDRVR